MPRLVKYFNWEGKSSAIIHLIKLCKHNFGEGNGNPLQYSCLENPMDGGVHGVVKSRTWLSDFTFTFHCHALEEEMATHSSVLAWRIPGTGEPGGLLSLGSHRVGHEWRNLVAAANITLLLQETLTQEDEATNNFIVLGTSKNLLI